MCYHTGNVRISDKYAVVVTDKTLVLLLVLVSLLITLLVTLNIQSLPMHPHPGPPKGLGGPRANTKSGAPQNGLCKGVWGHAPRKF